MIDASRALTGTLKRNGCDNNLSDDGTDGHDPRMVVRLTWRAQKETSSSPLILR
jgi:hypothetical protein